MSEEGEEACEICATCRVWLALQDDMGQCHRHSPTRLRIEILPSMVDDEDSFEDRSEAVWPRTAGDDWCGEWQPRRN